MTDDEINRKVAEIEEWQLTDGGRTAYSWHWARCVDTPTGKTMERFHGESPHPYATDWSWCGPLIDKYSIYLNRGRDWVAACGNDDAISADTPQRAICLAVIAAHQP